MTGEVGSHMTRSVRDGEAFLKHPCLALHSHGIPLLLWLLVLGGGVATFSARP